MSEIWNDQLKDGYSIQNQHPVSTNCHIGPLFAFPRQAHSNLLSCRSNIQLWALSGDLTRLKKWSNIMNGWVWWEAAVAF
ncbi:hypothetical protein [Sphingomonas sp. CFBP 8765]|uniref:hypothetical protein n=1 Tax=Sphingomonas sp. CFBP 8765 TaxID=2775274 RepID=UPI0017832819|nr:hypothetical protein [Sphingomonas sp. CFBP 8765]MBD8472087.1 hypothetical protein [Sphingomonas sp. CFBP 8765]